MNLSVLILSLITTQPSFSRNCQDKCTGQTKAHKVCYYDFKKKDSGSHKVVRFAEGCAYQRNDPKDSLGIISLFVKNASDAKIQTEKFLNTLGPCDRISQLHFGQATEAFITKARRHGTQDLGETTLGSSMGWIAAFDSKLIQCSLAGDLSVSIGGNTYSGNYCKGGIGAISASKSFPPNVRVSVSNSFNLFGETLLPLVRAKNDYKFSPKPSGSNRNTEFIDWCQTACNKGHRAVTQYPIDSGGGNLVSSEATKLIKEFCNDEKKKAILDRVNAVDAMLQACMGASSMDWFIENSDELFRALDFFELLYENISDACPPKQPKPKVNSSTKKANSI